MLITLSGADTKKLEDLTCGFEGFRARPYKDTKGILTWGYGTNLTTRALTEEEALMLLRDDMQAIEAELTKNIPGFTDLAPARKIALLDMCYNMGIHGLLGFGKMISSIKSGNFSQAAADMMDSTWGKENYRRAYQDSTLMEKGSF